MRRSPYFSRRRPLISFFCRSKRAFVNPDGLLLVKSALGSISEMNTSWTPASLNAFTKLHISAKMSSGLEITLMPLPSIAKKDEI